MYHHILPQIRARSIQRVLLEVLEGNLPAIRSYEKVGFKLRRTLNCYSGTMQSKEGRTELQIQRVPWNKYTQELLPSDIEPAWQNATASLARSPGSIVVATYLDDRPCGYVVLSTARQRLHQIVVHPQYRRRLVATALLHWITTHVCTIKEMSNVDAGAADLNHFLRGTGLDIQFRQLEIQLDLTTFTA